MTHRLSRSLGWTLGLAGLAFLGCGGSETSATQDRAQAATPPPAAEATPAADSPQAQLQSAPDFTLANVAGGDYRLSEHHGKVVLIDFWATWCGPCVRGIPHLNELYAAHKDNGFELVGISVDRDRGGVTGVDAVKRFLSKTRVDYPLAMADAKTVYAYGGIKTIPTAFLVDRQGKIRKRYVGLQPKIVFERDVKELLAEPAPDDDTSI